MIDGINYTVGDRVVCVEQHYEDLVNEGQYYLVLGFVRCKCGRIYVDVGIIKNGSICDIGCGARITTGFNVFKPSRFKKPDHLQMQLEEIEKSCIIEKESVPLH